MSSATTDAPAIRKSRWRRWVLALFLAALAGALLVGHGDLGFFNPYTLETRSQHEFTVWHGSIPIYRTKPRFRPEIQQDRLIAHLRSRGLVQPSTSGDRWDVVFHTNQAWKGGEGQSYDVLYRKCPSIIAWTHKHPELAKIACEEAFRNLRSEFRMDHEIGYRILACCYKCEDERELRNEIIEVKRMIYWNPWTLSEDERDYARSQRRIVGTPGSYISQQ